MKKISICLSIFLIIIAIFTACSQNQQVVDTTNVATAATVQDYGRNPIVVDPTFDDRTVGSVQSSEKFDNGKEYYIEYYDENGFVTKAESYENGKMIYYYTVVIADSMGNGKQLNYYTPSGSFIATQKDGGFFDASGNEMSETEFEKRLGL